MGIHLVGRAFALMAREEVNVTPSAALVLLFMARTAVDTDEIPRYFKSRDETVTALGRMVPDPVPESHPDHAAIERKRAAAFQALKVAIADLVRAGLVERVKRGQRGQRAEYVLRLDSALGLSTSSLPAQVGDPYRIEKGIPTPDSRQPLPLRKDRKTRGSRRGTTSRTSASHVPPVEKRRSA